ncbi:MAG: sulfatase-like hydrolase/transferase [Pseudomonadales bacterium]|nr:sulfatase-like hydrolase/transferase [Pseudomonadales bacterium]
MTACSRKTRLLLRAGIYCLLTVPLASSFYFSTIKSLAWLLSAQLALAFALMLLVILVDRLPGNAARKILGLMLLNIIAAFQLARLLSFYFQGESFNTRFFFHFNVNSLAEAGTAYQQLIFASLLFFGVLSVLGWFMFSSSHQTRHGGRLPAYSVALALLAGTLILEPDIAGFGKKQIHAFFSPSPVLSLDTIAWDELGLHRAALDDAMNDIYPGKNLVFVYLESLEKIYTDAAVFPGLTPNIDHLKTLGLDFAPMVQTDGTGWTVGGLVASQCGTPLLYGKGPGGNDILQSGFLSQAVCLADILKQAGYYQEFLGGASTRFAGKGAFLRNHGYDEVKGRAELSERLSDSSYQSGWGLYDDSLLDIAMEEFEKLAAGGRPFNLSLLTLDTHHPSGQASRSCPPYQAIDNSILHAVHCTDYLLGRFVERLSSHPAWEDTVLVLFSDHLAMRNAAQQYYPEGYDRQLLFLALNVAAARAATTVGTHMDVAPTVLALLGVGHEREFLAGRSLVDARQQAGRAADFFAAQRLAAIEYLNSNALTGSKKSLCENSRLLEVRKQALWVAGHEVALSISGEPLVLDAVGRTHAVVVLLNPMGEISSTMAVNVQNVPHVLYQFRDQAFLLIAPSGSLPARFAGTLSGRDDSASGHDIQVIMGRLGADLELLGSTSDIENLQLDNADCGSRLAQIGAGAGHANDTDLLARMCQSESRNLSYIDAATGDLHLTRVAHENSWYEAVLSSRGPGRYALLSRASLGSMNEQSDFAHCHAYFGNSELIIPRIELDGVSRSLRMRLIPGEDWQFEVLE